MTNFNNEQNPYTQEDLVRLNQEKIPYHVAMILDGNRRWAKKHHLPDSVGHWEGAENITKMVRSARYLGIKVLTLFVFSTENWSRPEVNDLMHLFETFLTHKKDVLYKEGVRISSIGSISAMPSSVQLALQNVKTATACCDQIDLVLAMNYGGRDDICRGIVRAIQDVQAGKLALEALSEEVFSSYLDTKTWPDPELFIRTSGERRLSNFLLWQMSYTEIHVTDVLWPDFDHSHLLEAIIDYQNRERRLGG